MEHILQMETYMSVPRYEYACYKPFTVNFPSKCEWQNRLNPDSKRAWSGIHASPRPIKALVLGCINGLKKGALLQTWTFINEYT
jgi:hypothetical protein